jgi:hypothetical protein
MTPEKIRRALDVYGCRDNHGCNCATTCLCALVETALEAVDAAYEDAAKIAKQYMTGEMGDIIAAAIRARIQGGEK